MAFGIRKNLKTFSSRPAEPCQSRDQAGATHNLSLLLPVSGKTPPSFSLPPPSEILGFHGGIAQLVERQLCKLDVRSSNLLASTGCRHLGGAIGEAASGVCSSVG